MESEIVIDEEEEDHSGKKLNTLPKTEDMSDDEKQTNYVDI